MKLSGVFLWKLSLFVLLSITSLSYAVFAKAKRINTEFSELREELNEIQAGLAELKKGFLTNQEPKVESKVVRSVKKEKSNILKSVHSDKELKNIQDEIDSIAVGLVKLRGIKNAKTESETILEGSPDLSLQRVPIGVSPFRQVRRKGLGFYVLPFFGFFQPNGLEWNSVGGDFEIEEEVGFSSGVRLGHGWKYFFSDFQVSYFYNEMESMDIGLPGLSFSGKTEGIGGHISSGVKVPFSQSFNFTLGGGIGGTYEDISFRLMGITVDEEDFLFSYQFFTGIEYHPTDYLRLGLRYRWLRVGEMDLLNARDLHLAELSLGYLF